MHSERHMEQNHRKFGFRWTYYDTQKTTLRQLKSITSPDAARAFSSIFHAPKLDFPALWSHQWFGHVIITPRVIPQITRWHSDVSTMNRRFLIQTTKRFGGASVKHRLAGDVQNYVRTNPIKTSHCSWCWFEFPYGVVSKGLLFSLVVFTKKARKLLPELWYIASRDKPPEKKNLSSRNTVSSS